MFISTCGNSLSENLVLFFFFAHFVLSEPRDKVGSCSDISEVSMVVMSVSFQRPDNILEMNFSFMNDWEGLLNKFCEQLEIM